MSRHNREGMKNGDAPKHTPHLSQGSTIAGSTLSNGESLRLADFPFPQPPPSIPSSPLKPVFLSVSNSFMQSRHVSRRTSSVPVRMLPPLPTQPQLPAYQPNPTPTTSVAATAPMVSTSPASPDDWHETISSLDVDAAEERLLPTSFVTSLLQQNTAVRTSTGSDAISRFSEITYPPINIPSSGSSRIPIRYTTLDQKPQGARPPPTSYNLRAHTDSFQSTSSDAHTYVVSENHAFRYTELRQSKGGVSGDTTVLNHSPSRPQSVASTRFRTPSILSRLSSSGRSIKQIFANSRAKPLPPVPLIPDISIATEREHREAEEATPLPELLVRADTLEDLLKRGQHPHHSLSSYDVISKDRDFAPSFDPNHEHALHGSSANQKSRSTVKAAGLDQDVTHRRLPSLTLKRGTFFLICLLLVVILVSIVVGVVVGRKPHNNTCADGMTGHDCDLNATCSCTSMDPRICQGVAQSVLDLVPYLNVQFMANKTNGDIYNSFWQTQILSPNNCANQALLIDVAPALSSQSSPNLTQWARTAILWNFIESQDLAASQQLQNFVLGAPWKEFGNNVQLFSTNVSGFTFDFALQKVVAPAQSFSVIGQPSPDQDSRLDSIARSALDYIYENAVASSTQRHMVLVNYWVSTLQRQPSDLQTFMTAVSESPIVLSFDATTSPLSSLLSTNPPATKFPPPLACYPGLPQSSVDLLNAVEHDIFNLPNIVPQTNFSLDCYPNHPVYGILDVLQLRLPPTGYPQQAAVLQSATTPRAAVYNGKFLSSSNASSNSAALTLAQLNPRRFGTLNHFEHVIFDYLNAMSTPLANAIIDFVLGSMNTTRVPPGQNSNVLSSLDQVPLIEVAVFGSVESSDIRWVESSFTMDSGALFFGSPRGSILRNWTVAGINSMLVWAQNATAPEVVRNQNLTDNKFNEIWNAASLAIQQNVPNSINNLTRSLAAWGYFAP